MPKKGCPPARCWIVVFNTYTHTYTHTKHPSKWSSCFETKTHLQVRTSQTLYPSCYFVIYESSWSTKGLGHHCNETGSSVFPGHVGPTSPQYRHSFDVGIRIIHTIRSFDAATGSTQTTPTCHACLGPWMLGEGGRGQWCVKSAV